jgi:O-antigen ligase
MKSFLNKINSTFFAEALLVNIFILNLFISTISNYRLYSFPLKLISTFLTASLIFYDSRKINVNLKDIFINSRFGKLSLITGIFLLIPILSLFYSSNQGFGFEKVIYLVISTIPAIIFFYYLCDTLTALRIKIFKYSVIITGLATSVLVIIYHPFSYDVYSFAVTNWSHVIYGRYIGLVLLVTIFFLLYETDKIKIFLYGAAVVLFGFNSYYTGLRASLIFITFILIILTIHYIITKKYSLLNFSIMISSVIITVIIILVTFPLTMNPGERYQYILPGVSGEKFFYEEDAAITSRIDSYNICIERIEESPLLGLGFGGFRSFYKNDLPVILAYPHNIFLEFAVELGVPGILLIIGLLYLIFKYSYKISFEVFCFFIYFFGLSLISKDIPSNTTLWIGLCFFAIPGDGFKKLWNDAICRKV